VHLLAYLYDPSHLALTQEQTRLRVERRARLRRIAERMVDDGYPLDIDSIFAALPPDSPAGRPHLAAALIRAGVVASVDEAFAQFLAAGARYYLPRADTPIHRAIEMITEAGGVTVLAHPFAASRGPIVTEEVIADLAASGLAGLEVANHDEAIRLRLRGIARELGLVATGSSDYHGTHKTVRIGQETTAPEQFEALVSQAKGIEVVAG
jgi:3',5'-nucleoside bisphosphate phosphatase